MPLLMKAIVTES